MRAAGLPAVFSGVFAPVETFFYTTAMLHIVLYHPEIPPNTGNVARLCAGTGAQLPLIEPLGFVIDDKHLKRAGLDYWPHVDWKVWPSLDAYLQADGAGRRLVCTSALICPSCSFSRSSASSAPGINQWPWDRYSS